MAAEPKMRTLGNLEKYHAVRHQMRFYTGVGVTATYRLPAAAAAGSRSLKDCVYRACEKVIQQHPSLSVNVVLEGTSEPYFVRLPEIDLDKCILFQHGRAEESSSWDAQVDDFLQEHHNTFFDSDAPLWKLCVLENPSSPETFTAAFIFHHVIADGTSGKVFHTSFAQALDQILQTSSQPESGVRSTLDPPAAALPPKLEDMMNLPLSAWFCVKEIYKAKFSSPNQSLWAGAPVHKNELVSRIKHLAVPEPTATRLRKTCSANDTTITAFLQILLARLLFQHIDTKFTQLTYQGSMSARRWISDPAIETLMGDWVLDYNETYHRGAIEGDDFPWHEAQAAKKSLANNLSSKGKNTGVGLLKYVSDIGKGVFSSQLDKPRSTSFEISNLGAFKMPEKKSDEGVAIERMIFTQSSGTTGAAIVVSVISGGDGCLVLAFSWQDSVVEASFVESLIAGLEQEIAKLS